MKVLKEVYIALGSNKGNKLEYLQLAVNMVFNMVGAVQKLSKIYQTPAMGFDAEDFYNACIKVETELSPNQLLKKLKAIEVRLGRQKNDTTSYQSRVIDLDVLFYEDKIVNESDLVIPHPEIQNRKFVLLPLLDVSKDFEHPVFKKSIDVLLQDCKDQSQILPVNVWLKSPIKSYVFNKFNYIAIEGNIGAGKTSLVNKIARDFNGKKILERFADNPFLPKFYKSPDRYAFTLEMSFLADRYQQISDDLAQLDLFKDFIVSDYDVNKSLVFSKITLPSDEFLLYRKLFNQVYRDVTQPDLYIYLYQNTNRLQENIKKRGRLYEADIKNEYLQQINTGYLDFLKSQTNLNVQIIDISDKDFVEKREDYIWLLNEINKEADAIR